MANYFLIARNIKNNSYKILELNEKWYLGYRGNDVSHKSTSLAAIDVVTTAFDDESHLIERLYSNNYIDSKDVDLFAACKRTRDGHNYIKFYDLLYKSNYSDKIRIIAKADLDNDISKERMTVISVYDKFISKLCHDEKFYFTIMGGLTDVPNAIVELFDGVNYDVDDPYSLKYKESWALRSYSTIRSIFEAIENDRKNVVEYYENGSSSSDNRNKIMMAREAIESELLRKFDKKNCENQMSLFDNQGNLKKSFSDSTSSEPKRVVKEKQVKAVEVLSQPSSSSKKNDSIEEIERMVEETSEKEKVKIPEIVIPQDLSTEEKISKIFSLLKNFPDNGLRRNDNKYSINLQLFNNTLSDREINRLNTSLSSIMYRYIWTYSFYYSKYKEASFYGYNTREYQEEFEWARQGISRRLQNEKRLNKVYNWFMLWDGCVKRDAIYGSSQPEGKRVKVYEKK